MGKTIWSLRMILFLGILAFSTRSWGDDTAIALVKKIEMNLAPPNARVFYKFTNYRTDGTVGEYEVRFSIRDPDHSHGVFIFPEREKGREILRLVDDIWSYIPSVAKVVRIADRDSFAGGDFSNADIMRVDWLAKYNASIIKDLPKQVIIEMVAKSPDAPYAKMRLWVDKGSGQPVQQHFYDSKGTLLKRCLYGEITKFSSIERPGRLLMENVITKQKSELIVKELSVTGGFPDSRFVVDNLGK